MVRAGELTMQEAAQGLGLVQHGEEKALGGPHSSPQCL